MAQCYYASAMSNAHSVRRCGGPDYMFVWIQYVSFGNTKGSIIVFATVVSSQAQSLMAQYNIKHTHTHTHTRTHALGGKLLVHD